MAAQRQRFELVMYIPKEDVLKVIGQGGKTLMLIASECKCSVTCTRNVNVRRGQKSQGYQEKDSLWSPVVATGDAGDVVKVYKRVEVLVDEMDDVVGKFRVAKALHAVLRRAAPLGSPIARISATNGVRVGIPDFNSTDDIIVVRAAGTRGCRGVVGGGWWVVGGCVGEGVRAGVLVFVDCEKSEQPGVFCILFGMGNGVRAWVRLFSSLDN